MTAGIDRLINEIVALRFEIDRLRAQVTTLQDQVGDRDDQVTTLQVMLREWPVVHPVLPARLH